MTGTQKTVQSKLKFLKRKYRLTNAALSELSGVPLATVNKLTNGEIKKPAFCIIDKLARALNVSVRFFSAENEVYDYAYIKSARDSFALTDEEYLLIHTLRGLSDKQRGFAVKGIDLLGKSSTEDELILPMFKTGDNGKIKLTNVFVKQGAITELSDFAYLVPDSESAPFFARNELIGFSMRKPKKDELCLAAYAGRFYVRIIKQKENTVQLTSLCTGIPPVTVKNGVRLSVIGTAVGKLQRA